MTNTPAVKLIDSELSIDNENSEVLALNFDIEQGLSIIYEVKPNKIFEIHFNPYIYGFRVLDEGDLIEFWGVDSYQSFGIYEVLKGGWHSLEQMRSGFLTGFTNQEYAEYLVTGINDCVSILAHPQNSPVITERKE